MLRWAPRALVLSSPLLGVLACARAQALEHPEPSAVADALPSVAEFSAELDVHPGFVPLWTDAARGRVYAELDAGQTLECLYVEALARGLGANPVGLDRSEVGPTQLVQIRVVGERAVFEALNTGFRASSGDPDERAAAEAAFPRSVLAAAPLVAREGERVLVDLEPLLIRDAHGVARSLAARNEGTWTLDPATSFPELDAIRAFPDNVELEATLSFRSDAPGRWSGSTAPAEALLGLRAHLSLVRLPEPGFELREVPARMGAMGRSHLDFSAALEHPLRRELALRHRLAADETLVYYLDRGVPEPIRGALLEGASWWAEAFAQPGVPGGFRVELLPPDADPLDVRYNMINWVHRSTRGWSYGASIIDPRTGEILKASVTLGSQRVRQDRRIFEALLGAQGSGAGGPEDPVELALARVRQLAAHEVGHTLGFAHNFAASSYGRASVMDYPAPLVHLVGEDEAAALDVSEAYGVGLGAWDRLAFAYLYSEWPEREAESAGLAGLLAEADARGLWLLSDAETHTPGAAHPEAAVWDNGADSLAALREVLAVRGHALARFGAHNLGPEADPRELELNLAPLYFFHRYQLAAAAKLIAGQRHELGPTLLPSIEAVAPARQREAIAAILATLTPEVLRLPSALLALMRPTPEPHIDGLPSYAGPNFDPYALAAAAAAMGVTELLDPHRAHRLEALHAEASENPSFAELLDTSVAALWSRASVGGSNADVLALELVHEAFVEGLLGLSANASASPRVRALAELELASLADRLGRSRSAHDQLLAGRATRWLTRALASERPAAHPAPLAPPGSPIGGGSETMGGCGYGDPPWFVSPAR